MQLFQKKSKQANEVMEVETLNAFKFVYWTWRVIGIYSPSANKRSLQNSAYQCYAVFIIVLCYICLPLTLVIELFYVNSIEEAIFNISVSTSFVNSSLKYFVIFANIDLLLKTRPILAKLDKRCKRNAIDRKHIAEAIAICHKISLIYIFCYNFVGLGYAYAGYKAQKLMYSGWFPKLYKENAGANYRLAYWYQFVAQMFSIMQNASNDMYPPCHLAVMTAHMRALKARIERIGKEPERSNEENFEELLACIEDHKLIFSFFDCIRKPISRTIFFQFLIMAFVLCLNVINFLLFDLDVVQMLATAGYLFAILIEAFPCCWFVNELMDEVDALTTALYNCLWYEQDKRFKRTLIIFMQRSQRPIVLKAANLASVTLQTFLAVIRFSFSIYTILSKINV